jgi:hypothetical protein
MNVHELEQELRELRGLEGEVHDLRSRVARLELERPLPIAAEADAMLAVAEMTIAVFGVEPSFRPAVDPETKDRHIDVEVRVGGSDEEILRQAADWHQRLAALHTPAIYSLSPQFDEPR